MNNWHTNLPCFAHCNPRSCGCKEQNRQRTLYNKRQIRWKENQIKISPPLDRKGAKKEKNKKHKPLTKYKNHRADKGFMEHIALN